MKVATFIKVLAMALLIGAGISFYLYFANEGGMGSLLTGITCILMAMCGLLVLTNKEIANMKVGSLSSVLTGRDSVDKQSVE
ncbi:MAG: hypothetical protein WD035_03375 [Balneolaceae bacterium]